MKNKIIIFSLIFLVFISISAVSAADNTTDVVSSGDDYNAEIIVEDYNTHYQSEDQLYFELVSYYNGPDDCAYFDIIDNKSGEKIGYARYIEGKSYAYTYATVGVYNATIKLTDYDYTPYKVKPVTINIKITKAPVKVTADKWISTTKQYVTLKVIVKDEYNYPVEEGTVKFVINGKTYAVKVKDGVATKKVKITKPGTYTYKATFSSSNFKSKTVSSKVYVKKAKKYYTFKVGKYVYKVNYNNYLKLIDAKNNKKVKAVSKVVGKQYGKYPIHMSVFTSPKDLQYPKGDYVDVWIDDGRGMDGYSAYKKINLYTLNP